MKFPDKKKSLKKLEKWITRQRVQSVFLLALSLTVLYQFSQFSELRDKVDSVDGLEKSTSTVLQEVSQGKDYLTSFGSDLNEIRKFLLLPTKNYDFNESEEVNLASEGGEEEDLNTLLFNYVARLGEYEKNQKEYEANLSTLQTVLVETYWGEHGLTVDANGNPSDASIDFSFLDTSLANEEVFKISLSYNGAFTVETVDEDLELSDKSSASSVVTDVKAYVENELTGVREHLQLLGTSRSFLSSLLGSVAVQAMLGAQHLTLGTELESHEEYHYQFLNTDHDTVAELSISKEDGTMLLSLTAPLEGHDSDYSMTREDAESVLTKALSEAVDTRTDTAKLVEKNRKDIETAFGDRAFQAVLSEMGLQFGAAQETDTRISYPITNAAGETLRVLFIDKATGEVKVENSDGQNSQELSMAIQEFDWSGKKKLSTQVLA